MPRMKNFWGGDGTGQQNRKRKQDWERDRTQNKTRKKQCGGRHQSVNRTARTARAARAAKAARAARAARTAREIGRASCRGRGEIEVVGG